ncbi:hypothetical protein HPB48_000773 [Haemaphysalis longicornis]|uniref:ATP-dependent DNA helicase n=1 Tax=Haemaphysalis longicornis TaxID=44386 RepID=A0A9J6GBI6_HAELO|nr:hypothetical protein HPB48_000773 [Haemaphysalis longicornis]
MSNLHKAMNDMVSENGDMTYPEVSRDVRKEASRRLHTPPCFPHERVHVRKSKTELEELPAHSTDVWRDIIDENHKRPEELQEVKKPGAEERYQFRCMPIVIPSLRDARRAQLPKRIGAALRSFRNDHVDVLDNNAFVKTYEERLTDIWKRDTKAAPQIRINAGNEDVLGEHEVSKALADRSSCSADRKWQNIMDITQPPRRVFTGPAGCGRTLVLKLAMDITGKAAVAVGVTTVPSAFKLCRSLSHDKFRNDRCAIIDKISVMSADQLEAIDVSLQHITQNWLDDFGGFDVILCGDSRQQTPMDLRVSTILTKMGDGASLHEEELALIESRFITVDEAAHLAPEAVRLYYANKVVDAYNVGLAANDPGAMEIQAQDEMRGWRTEAYRVRMTLKVSDMSSTELSNMPATIMLSVGRPYMLTANTTCSTDW